MKFSPLLIPLLAFMGACDGKDILTSEGEEVANLAPTLENIQEHIFDKACATSGCHDLGGSAGGLDLSSADASFASLVGVPVVNSVASENGWLRVKPGDPDLSFLVRKCGTPGLGEGAPMPIGSYQLHEYYQLLVADWIVEGALR